MDSPKTCAFTWIELVLVLAFIALLLAMLLPALGGAKQRAERATCAGELMGIGIGFKTWAIKRTNAYPMVVRAEGGGTREAAEKGTVFRHFQVLSNELSTPKTLVCPADKERKPAKDFDSLSNTNISYFVGLDAREETPQMILGGDRNVTNATPLGPDRILEVTTNTVLGWTHEKHNLQGNVLLADSSVQRVSSATLAVQVAHSGGTNRLAVP